MKILYCDCFSGISGDMFLGALLDAGLQAEYLDAQFKLLNLPEYQGVAAEKIHKGALAATQLRLDIHEHVHKHEHDHYQERGLNEIRTLIEDSALSTLVKGTSLNIFQKLAEAEAKVHGTLIDEVHFHEVGAADSILDIVGAAIGLDFFGIQEVFSSALPLGSGQVNTRHGMLPLPAPATLELLSMAQAPVTASPATFELVTPTGAAILAATAKFRQPDMNIHHIGMGAGQKDLEWPNVLRILIGTYSEPQGNHLEIETNIDDMNPQIYSHVMAKLFQNGALDVYFTPITMKKNRPAIKLSVIARKEDEQTICYLILQETSTLGVRVKSVWRHEAKRETRMIDTHFGRVPVKLKILDDVVVQASPEYDECDRLALQAGVPLAVVLQEASLACWLFIREQQEE